MMIKKVTTKKGAKMKKMKKMKKKKSTDAVKVHGGEITNKTSTISHNLATRKAKAGVEPTYIYQFISKKVGGKRQKVAVLFGDVDKGGLIKIGWARAKVNHGDKFNPTIALKIAKGRAEAEQFIPVCPSLYEDAVEFRNRCIRYFKQASGSVVVTKQPNSPKEIDVTVLDKLLESDSI